MKKISNDPFDYAEEALKGLVRAYPQYYQLVEGTTRVISRPGEAKPGKVGIVSGGGSGHLPIFTGYVGPGFLDAVANGDVFASPSVSQISTAIRTASGDAGVLLLYGNYGGDVMNFDMASDMLEDEVQCATVVLADDVASAPLSERHKRRGVAGMVFTFKIAGAAAEAGLNLAEVSRIAQKAADGCRSMGVALSPCMLPQVGKPTFEIADDEMEVGMGIHGEPGVARTKLAPANDIADAMIEPLLKDIDLRRGSRVALLVNSLGATPAEELFILYNRIADRLVDTGIEIAFPLVGRYATSMEMAGVSTTLLALDDELESFLTAPAACAFWKV
ncbi:dihydroxyacetone kinase subunit DhaK [Novosphingobium mathurense]|uniref:Dihydroxyacetone kinase DhaK subunit n=1 Tax=Novosphingobium mathurense TaxID=428990 RepID=A0A1U6IM19_9SPHN|nr:dihydroxyacetone kinase subunit DhaK [Novosphingobium mathurense]SLK09022.1 dihydroxyacetone kinase DhaK subunit [Novosphingobium mathurense]